MKRWQMRVLDLCGTTMQFGGLIMTVSALSEQQWLSAALAFCVVSAANWPMEKAARWRAWRSEIERFPNGVTLHYTLTKGKVTAITITPMGGVPACAPSGIGHDPEAKE